VSIRPAEPASVSIRPAEPASVPVPAESVPVPVRPSRHRYRCGRPSRHRCWCGRARIGAGAVDGGATSGHVGPRGGRTSVGGVTPKGHWRLPSWRRICAGPTEPTGPSWPQRSSAVSGILAGRRRHRGGGPVGPTGPSRPQRCSAVSGNPEPVAAMMADDLCRTCGTVTVSAEFWRQRQSGGSRRHRRGGLCRTYRTGIAPTTPRRSGVRGVPPGDQREPRVSASYGEGAHRVRDVVPRAVGPHLTKATQITASGAPWHPHRYLHRSARHPPPRTAADTTPQRTAPRLHAPRRHRTAEHPPPRR
jgi:hypothetical protein